MNYVTSKQRVADHGEVFTPAWLVEAMLDLVKAETERIDSRFLEPACGSGNFLVPILRRSGMPARLLDSPASPRRPLGLTPGVDRPRRHDAVAAATGQLARFVVFGSFVTAKAEPNDVDIFLLMEDVFDLASVTGEAALVFQHMEAHAHFGASVFWSKRSGALGGEQAVIEYWQARRAGGRRGIVEIVRDGS